MVARIVLVGVALGALALWASRSSARPLDLPAPGLALSTGPFGELLQGVGDAGAELLATAEELLPLGPSPDEVLAMSSELNVQAFLRMIRVAEGTSGPLGYNTMFGGGTFDDFSDHPRIVNTATFNNGKTVSSSAAGAYQFLARTWDGAASALGLLDFSPANQDAAAVYLIKRRGALDDVREGRFSDAVRKCAKEWASLPGSPYGQPTISADRALALFQSFGGVALA